MSLKNLDQRGRWRNKTIAFRVSPEEDALINRMVAMSGLFKQDYITHRLLMKDVVVVPNSRVQKALRNSMLLVYGELRQLRNVSDIEPDTHHIITSLATIFAELGDANYVSDSEISDNAIHKLNRS